MAIYLEFFHSGELDKRVKTAKELLQNCQVCPRKCNVDRLGGEIGYCRTPKLASISSYGPHFGEESPLVGNNGSGTIFFTNCNLSCVFCQNYTISHLGNGVYVTSGKIAEIMLSLQAKGCHNINLVSPSHVVPQILEALQLAVTAGLHLPLVYNTGGYDSLRTLQILDGVVDIYMPDMKYADESTAERLSGIKDYPLINRNAVKEMYRQVGNLEIDGNGIAIRGLLIRHLLLPSGLAGTENTMKYISQEISPNSYVNVMAQYKPCYKASEMPELARPSSMKECREAIEIARKAGLKRLDRIDPIAARAA